MDEALNSPGHAKARPSSIGTAIGPTITVWGSEEGLEHQEGRGSERGRPAGTKRRANASELQGGETTL